MEQNPVLGFYRRYSPWTIPFCVIERGFCVANVISYEKKNMDMMCSNGSMDVLLTTIGLSGSYLAEQWYEKDLIVWLMEKDQSVVGLGTVGFDISEMPWNKIYFAKQKAFLYKTLQCTKKCVGWDTLDYMPNKILLFEKIDVLQKMLTKMVLEDIDDEAIQQWYDACDMIEPMKNGYPVCEKHGILLSAYGCMACHDI